VGGSYKPSAEDEFSPDMKHPIAQEPLKNPEKLVNYKLFSRSFKKSFKPYSCSSPFSVLTSLQP
jgi:hypothetical protein